MAILFCTHKVLNELGLSKNKVLSLAHSESSLENWYVNLFYQDRKKCLIFTQAETLFTFVVPNLLRKDIVPIKELLKKELSRAMYHKDFKADEIQKVLAVLETITISQTQSRSVLGCMNDLVFQYSVHIDPAYHPAPIDLAEINHRLNEVPMKCLGWKYALERFREAVSKA